VRRLTAATANLVLLRAQFAAVELAQARAQLVRWLLLALVVLGLALLGLLAATALFAIAFWPQLGGWALALPAAAYLLLAALLLRRLQREVAEAPPPLADTLQELAHDRDALRAAASGQTADPDRTSAGSNQ